jgi:hypothetical protein
MSDQTPDELVARIEAQQEETRKFTAEMHKQIARITEDESMPSDLARGIAIVAAPAAVFLLLVLAASAWIHPAPQQIVVQLPQPLLIKVVP